jgi:acyl-coenzyme A thioesterase PaaI-like protein
MTSFADATAARRIGDGRYAVELDLGYTPEITGIVHGGYLLATVLRAVLDASPHPDPVVTSAHFLRPGMPGPAEVRLESLREGRTVAVTRASVVQGGKTVLSAHVTTATLGEDPQTLWTSKPPPMPPVEECAPLDAAHPLGPGTRFLERLDLRLDPATAGWLDGAPSGVPEIRGYFRLREGHPPDPFLVALAVDAKPPVPLSAGLFGAITTVELTLHLRGHPADGPLQLYARGRLVGDDWSDEDVEVWDSAGHLVAQSRQLMRRASGR